MGFDCTPIGSEDAAMVSQADPMKLWEPSAGSSANPRIHQELSHGIGSTQ